MDSQPGTAPQEIRTGGAITLGVLSILIPVVGVVFGIIAIVKGTKGLGKAPAGHPARGGCIAAIVLGAVGLLIQFTFWLSMVLAAVVFVMVQDLGDSQEGTPSIAFLKDEGDDQLTVTRADSGVDWSDFQIRADGGPVYVRLNGDADRQAMQVGSTLTAFPPVALTGADFLDFCAEGGARDVGITLIHTSSNAQIYQTTLVTIQAC